MGVLLQKRKSILKLKNQKKQNQGFKYKKNKMGNAVGFLTTKFMTKYLYNKKKRFYINLINIIMFIKRNLFC